MQDAERRRFELEEACKRAAPKGVTCAASIAPIFTRTAAENVQTSSTSTRRSPASSCWAGIRGWRWQCWPTRPWKLHWLRCIERGGVIAGTSAGGAMQARVMIADYSPNFASGNALDRGAADLWDDEDRRGLVVGVQGALLDQHFFQRGRMGRLLGAILRSDAPHLGIGVDAYTGLRIVDGKVLTDVFGLYTVAVLDAATYGAAAGATYVGDRATVSARNVLVHLLAPGAFSYDLAARRSSVAPPVAVLTRTLDALMLPAGAGPLFLTGGLALDSDVWTQFAELTGDGDAPLLVVAAGYPNDRPAQRAADRLAAALGKDVETVVLSNKSEAVLELDKSYRGIVVAGRDQSLLQPQRLAPVKNAWLAGTPLLLDGGAAAIAGPVFSAHGPPPEDADAAEIAIQRSFLAGRTVITDGLALLDVTIEPHILSETRWGRLFSLGYTHPELVAFAVTDGSALALTASGAKVLGDNAVLSLDLRGATLALGDNKAFVIANGLLDIFAPGDEVLLQPVAVE